MGIFDHRKTWHFTVRATRDDCFRAFDTVMTKGPGLRLRGVKWTVRSGATNDSTSGARRLTRIAKYQNRVGIAAFFTILYGERARTAEKIAVGSEVEFADMGSPEPGVTKCAMHLGTYGSALGLTGDAGYIRAYLRDVERELRKLDAGLVVEKV